MDAARPASDERTADRDNAYARTLRERDALVARVADLEARLRDEEMERGQFQRAYEDEKELREAAEAQVAALTQERDVLNDKALTLEECWLEEEARAEAAEAALANTRQALTRQLTPLDVAITHVEVVRRKGNEYTAEERDNVLAVVETHVREARAALFSAAGDNTTEPGDYIAQWKGEA